MMWLIGKIKQNPWIIPTIIFSILVILGANMHPLWGDEAETALFARNIVKYGVPRGWDGVNIMGINNAVVLDKNLINHTSPWAQYYLAAASFALFGESSFTARLPFIVLSIFSIPLLYLLTVEVTKSRKISILASIITSLSVPFILFSFQARYYTITSFCALLLTYSCASLAKKSLLPKILFVVSGALFFYGNYLSFAVFYLSLFTGFLLYLMVHKKRFADIRRFIFTFVVLSIPIALFTVPWYIILKPFESRGELIFPGLRQSFSSLSYIFAEILALYNNNGLPKLIILALIVLFILKLRKREPLGSFVLFLTIPLLYLTIMSVVTLVAVVDTTFTATRYTMVIYPFVMILIAMVIAEIYRLQKSLAIIVLALYVTTNIFALVKIRSLPLEFLKEMNNPYSTPDIVVADYLKENAQEGDTAFVNIDRDHEPLIFHLGGKIKFIDRVSLVNTRIFPKNRHIIPRYIYDFRDKPDWIILFSKRGDDGSFLTFDWRPLPQEINLERDYEEIVLPVFFSDMSRPEIELRSFEQIMPTYEDQVFVYRKKP